MSQPAVEAIPKTARMAQSVPRRHVGWSRRVPVRLLTIVSVLILFVAGGVWLMTTMPGESFQGPLPELTAGQQSLAAQLERDVRHLSEIIGPRHVGKPDHLDAAARFIQERLIQLGYKASEQTYQVNGVTCRNFAVEIAGAADANAIVLIGAHYDTVPESPGADDNATAVAVLLAMAEQLKTSTPARTIRLVWFVNEEPPHFQTPQMGSYVHAKACRDREDQIVAMLALDGLGYYSDEPGSQHYPPPFDMLYPDRGNFIAFVTRVKDRTLLHQCIGAFRKRATVPSEGGAVPDILPGTAWSDHWSFWQFDYPALMVTDTLPFRNPNYHTPEDTADRLDYERLTLVADGLSAVVRDLANGGRE